MLRNRFRLALGLLALPCAFTYGLTTLKAWADDTEKTEKRVTLLYTTDTHGIYHPTKDGRSTTLSGGFAALDAKVKEIRAQSKNPVFLFDSGDVMTGNPICDVESQGVMGGELFRMMNAVGYDGWCLGNHDFDKGRENTAKIIEFVKFPTLDANLKADESAPPLKTERWKILEKDGFKIGVFGLMTESLDKVTAPEKMKGITVSSTAVAARDAVAALSSKCDLIVALSHCGSDEDIKLVDSVKGIDVILSGHNHVPLKPKWHGRTIVTEGHTHTSELSELNLTVKNGRLADEFTSESLKLELKDPTGDMKVVLDEVQELIGKKLAEVIAKLETPWKRENNFESNVGDFVADAIRDAAKTDVAFLNSGGIRKNVPTGDVTLGDIKEMLISGEVRKFELSGADLLLTIENNANASFSRAYGVLQISGIKYSYRHAGGKTAKVLDASVGGQPIDPKKTYTCATTDFVVDQHEKYFGPGVTVQKPEDLKLALADVAEAYVRAQAAKGPIKTDVDGRMKDERKEK